MKLKLALFLYLIMDATIASADIKVSVDRKVQLVTSSEQDKPLTQQQYDQQIEQYITQVNETKKILDVPKNDAIDAAMQKTALCQRIQAYEHIYALSEHNSHLNNATMMKYVAQSFLHRQKSSLDSSGMNQAEFCP